MDKPRLVEPAAFSQQLDENLGKEGDAKPSGLL